MFKLTKIVKREDDFAEWYTSVIYNGQLIVYGMVRGTIIFQPNAWFIWEQIQKYTNKEFTKLNINNVALPLLIPYSELNKEKKHLEGFAPECFFVNQIGNKKIDDSYVIRPTSEISFCKYFNHIVSSYKNLPIKVNQWCSVMRAEKTTRPFLRNSEFHWQEMHSIHETKNDAIKFAKQIWNVYKKIINDLLCIPTIDGEKTIGERFAGAEMTLTLEALMQDGQMLQCGTSHYLGQNFSKIYDIKFQNKDNKFEFVHQNSAGISTRLLGALIMVHADDNGLVLPPDLAKTQIIINITNNKEPKLITIAKTIKKILSKYRVEIDDSNKGIGFKLSNGEINGVPLQIILGNDALKNNNVTVIKRNDLIKNNVNIDNLKQYIQKSFKNIKTEMYLKAKEHLDNSIIEVQSIEQLKEVLANKKIAKCYWAGSEQDEKTIKELTGATPRCIIDTNAKESNCFFTNKKTSTIVIFGRAY